MPTIIYTDSVPNPPNLPSQDVGSMQTNTANIAAFVAQDHFPFNDNVGGGRSGWHEQVTMQNQAAPGIPAPMNGVLYANLSGGNSWPFWQNTIGSFQLIGSASATLPSAVTNGFTFLPGGIILQWGQIAQVNLVTNPVVFPTPFIGGVFNIQVTTTRTGSGSPGGTSGYFIDNSSIVLTGFNIQNSSTHAYGYNWVAIGN